MGPPRSERTPVQVVELSEVTALVAGVRHTLALRRDGTLWAWGSNNAGQLGDGRTWERHSPVQVSEATR